MTEEELHGGRHSGHGGQNGGYCRYDLAGARFSKEQAGNTGAADNKRGEKRHERRVKRSLQKGIHNMNSL